MYIAYWFLFVCVHASGIHTCSLTAPGGPVQCAKQAEIIQAWADERNTKDYNITVGCVTSGDYV